MTDLCMLSPACGAPASRAPMATATIPAPCLILHPLLQDIMRSIHQVKESVPCHARAPRNPHLHKASQQNSRSHRYPQHSRMRTACAAAAVHKAAWTAQQQQGRKPRCICLLQTLPAAQTIHSERSVVRAHTGCPESANANANLMQELQCTNMMHTTPNITTSIQSYNRL